MDKTIRITSTWVYEEIYDYQIDADLPDGWDDWDKEQKAEWVYNESFDCYQVLTEPLQEIELQDVEVI